MYVFYQINIFYFLFISVFISYISTLHVITKHSCDFISPLLELSFQTPPTIHFEEPSDEKTIYIFSPHGFMPVGIVWLLGQEPFKRKTYLLVSKHLLHYWFAKWVLLLRGRIMEISKENIEWCLNNGYSVMISLGGIREMVLERPIEARPDDFCLYTGHEKIFEIAKSKKVSITPILCDGQQNLHVNPINYITHTMYKYIKYPIPFIFTNNYGFPISNRVPFVFYISKSIKNCTKTQLYDTYKEVCENKIKKNIFLIDKK